MAIENSLELHILNETRKKLYIENLQYSQTGKLIPESNYHIKEITDCLNSHKDLLNNPESAYKSSEINALALIEKINHYFIKKYLMIVDKTATKKSLSLLNKIYGSEQIDIVFIKYLDLYPNCRISSNETNSSRFLETTINSTPVRELILEEIILLKICNNNNAARNLVEIYDDSQLAKNTKYTPLFYSILEFFDKFPSSGFISENLIRFLMEPAQKYPTSLYDQLKYIKKNWAFFIEDFILMLMKGMDMIKEENKQSFHGSGPTKIIEFNNSNDDSPNYSQDSSWMPEVVLLAKNTLVWMDQLSKKYKKEIIRLDQIPDDELGIIASRGINCLWLIGIWNRSNASKEIKKRCGNKNAESSAYSLFSYDISCELGGWDAIADLRQRCMAKGIRLASDMVPNHTGIDSEWTRSKPQWFIQTDQPPFPSYSYNSDNLSEDPGIGLYLEDNYYNKSDAAVTFKRVDFHSGETRYIYHGNDGTTMPWNDTAQLDFLQQEVREAVINQIIHVARNFPVIRFDAAMTLAKKHIQRLWYPEPGKGGAIPSRSNFSLSKEEFERTLNGEFWKEVVSRIADEVPGTLLLAEAFWMMEGYFVRNLGIHRVYNSAFMNMIKNEENDKYRETIKNTLNYDRKILKRFVNFMNNPDEETAAIQFGTEDKYFGVFTMMITMPGLPMIGHGQIEGFKEKYGMEYKKALLDEHENPIFLDRHEKEIFPILRKRHLFVSGNRFRLYDMINNNGSINDDVFAYSNNNDNEYVLIFYNNRYHSSSGYIKDSVHFAESNNGKTTFERNSLGESLNLSNNSNYYCLFKEIKSSKWYIRCNRDLFNNGLFIELNGYESQVFTEIHEIENNESNYIADIEIKLNGSGSKNLDREYREIVFKPLYAELKKLINPKIIELISSWNFSFTSFSLSMKNSFAEVITFIKNFSGGTGKVETIVENLMDDLSIPEKLTKSSIIENIILEYLENGFGVTNRIIYYLVSLFKHFSTILFSLTRGRINRSLLDDWMIIELLHDLFTDIDLEYDQIESILMQLRFYTESYDKEKMDPFKPLNRKSLVLLSQMRGFSELIGQNNYNHINWFSKDKFEMLLWWLCFNSLSEILKLKGKKADFKILYESIIKWKKISEESEYNYNNFISQIR